MSSTLFWLEVFLRAQQAVLRGRPRWNAAGPGIVASAKAPWKTT